MTLYFNSDASGAGGDNAWDDILNWWEDSACTVPHNGLPAIADDCILFSDVGEISAASQFSTCNSVVTQGCTDLGGVHPLYVTTSVTLNDCELEVDIMSNGSGAPTIYFNGTSSLGGSARVTQGNCVFNDYSTLQSGSVVQGAGLVHRFNDCSVCYGMVDVSAGSGPAPKDTVSFNDFSSIGDGAQIAGGQLANGTGLYMNDQSYCAAQSYINNVYIISPGLDSLNIYATVLMPFTRVPVTGGVQFLEPI